MKRMIVTTYWETVDTSTNLGTEANPFYAVNKGDFEKKSRVFYRTDETVRQLVKRARRARRFAGWVRNGFKTHSESQYGIASYQTITIEK